MSIKLLGGIRPITGKGAIRDIVAGITLASMNIPQVLGYTRIAMTPVVTGLYTALLPVFLFALLGSSRQLVVAADSATAAILAGSLTHMAPPHSAQYMSLVGMVALQTAALLLVARIFRLGFLADFLSRTVLVGFLTGVGFQIGIAMLGSMTGVEFTSSRSLLQLGELASRHADIHIPSLMLALLVAGIILVGHRIAPRLPIALFVVVGTIAASAAFGFAAHGISVIGMVPEGLPSPSLPEVSWRDGLATLPVALSCFVMILAQSAATARGFAQRHHELTDQDADILGLSAANAAAAVTGTFVVNGSPSQTAMAEQAGASSQVAQVAFAGTVLLVLLFFTGPLQYLPHCALAAIVFTIAIGMVDVAGLRRIGAESPGEFKLAVGTATAVVVIGVEQGILLAIGLSLLRHVRHSYRPNTSVLAIDGVGHHAPIPAVAGAQTQPGLIVYEFGADLFYANANRFVEDVRNLVAHAPAPTRWFVVDAGAVTDIDYSAAQTLRDLIADLQQQGVDLALARVRPGLRADLARHGVIAALGQDRIFGTMHEALAVANMALAEQAQKT
ncbi:MAG: SulP family inorganic anion transporter [Dechloromonas sp.]|nr:SulP family inorganic anion transporter [Dechloromonas sp.]